MPSDVSWDGVPLARGANVRVEEGGWFVEVEQPMPVGTRLELAGDVEGAVEVVRVHEGAGAGMLVKKAGAAASSTAEAEDAPEKDNGGGKKEKRKKKR